MKKIRVLWIVGAAVYAAVFACLFELGQRSAYVWSLMEDQASVKDVLSGDWEMILIAVILGLILGGVTCLMALKVRAFWEIRIGKNKVRISALVILLLVDLLSVGYLGYEAYARSCRYHEERDQIASVRALLAQQKRIFHAGGEIAGPDGAVHRYTNSREAFQQCLDRGVCFVELDFRFTTDGEMACIHKWHEDFVKADGTLAGEAVSLEEFLQGKIQGCLTPMTVEDVAAAMREHPDLYIVVDLKGEDVIRGYRILAKRYPDLITRMIPQFYHATQFNYLHNLGYRAMIFTLYRSGDWELTESALNSFTMRQMLVGVTMGTYRVGDGSLVRQVLKTRQPVYIHTVDDPALAQELYDMGVSAVYTNMIS